MGRVIDVLIIIAVGIAMVLGLLLLTWILAKMFDQYCCCCCCRPESSLAAEREFDRGVVSRKARLWGLLQTERTQILQHLFHPVVWSGNDEDVEANVIVTDAGKGDINADANTTKKDQVGQPAFSPGTSNQPSDSNPMDDAQHQRVCCICLNPYQPNCQVMTGNTCSHMFHYNCCMKWLKRHDDCPYCRQELMTGQQFREAAIHVLGETRVRGMSGAWLQVQENPTTGDDNGVNNDDDSGTNSNGQIFQQPAEEGGDSIEMGRVADHENQLSDIEA